MQDLEAIFREEHGRILSSLLRQMKDWQLAEDALMDAMATALERWPVEGLPDNPGAWLMSAARRRAIDAVRRRQTRTTYAPALRDHLELVVEERQALEEEMGDDRLSLLFTCCHPALALEARVALTLRYVGGLTTVEVARAFLTPEATMAKRLVRAKAKIAGAGIPYKVPDDHELPDRVEAVCRVLYLVFNEGYAATQGDDLVRRELCDEAIRLTGVLRGLMPTVGEIASLWSLMTLTHARRLARVDDAGDLVLLADQDRQMWDREAIDAGHAVLQDALRMGPPGLYAIQACIADLHCSAVDADATDWPQIVALYEVLWRRTRSPVVRLNQGVAVAMAGDVAGGLALMEAEDVSKRLGKHHRWFAARGDLLRRLGRRSEAFVAFAHAAELASNTAEKRYLERARDGCADA